MSQRLCPRCRYVVHFEDERSLVFCGHCGAPQVRLSEELREQAERQRAAEAEGDLPPADLPLGPAPGEIAWPRLIRYTLVIAAALSFFVLLLPPLALLAPPLVLAVYAGRYRAAGITAGVGATVGTLCAIFVGLGAVLLETCGLLVLRFGMHGMGEMDSGFQAALLRAKAQVTAQMGAATADAVTRYFTIPEFRVGIYLAGLAMAGLMLLVLSVASGAFAGYLRSRSRVRP